MYESLRLNYFFLVLEFRHLVCEWAMAVVFMKDQTGKFSYVTSTNCNGSFFLFLRY